MSICSTQLFLWHYVFLDERPGSVLWAYRLVFAPFIRRVRYVFFLSKCLWAHLLVGEGNSYGYVCSRFQSIVVEFGRLSSIVWFLGADWLLCVFTKRGECFYRFCILVLILLPIFCVISTCQGGLLCYFSWKRVEFLFVSIRFIYTFVMKHSYLKRCISEEKHFLQVVLCH